MGEYAEQAMREESIKKYGVDVYEDVATVKKKDSARERRRERRKHLQKGKK